MNTIISPLTKEIAQRSQTPLILCESRGYLFCRFLSISAHDHLSLSSEIGFFFMNNFFPKDPDRLGKSGVTQKA